MVDLGKWAAEDYRVPTPDVPGDAGLTVLYRGAVRTSARLVEARRSTGPVGYTGWRSETGHHGVIVAGYSNHLRAGPVIVNGRRQRITEIGMQSAYVTLHPDDVIWFGCDGPTVPALKDADLVEVANAAIGVLANRVRQAVT